MNWHWEMVLTITIFTLVCMWAVFYGAECEEHEWIARTPIEFKNGNIREYCNRCGRDRDA